MKRVLVLDGGGVKGAMQTVVLEEIENRCGKKISELFDLIVGTSAGAITGALYASGKLNAIELNNRLEKAMRETFKTNFFRYPKYRQKHITELYNNILGESYRLGDLPAKFISTSVNLVDGKTHFFKSWEHKDSQIPITQAISRSYSASYFFGSLVDNVAKAVWIDGGMGNQNCPLLEAFTETNRQGWLNNEEVYILSIGTGHIDHKLDFSKAKRKNAIREIQFFIDPFNGGLARGQAIDSKVKVVESFAQHSNRLSFNRLDTIFNKNETSLDKIDNIKEFNRYQDIGKNLINQVDWSKF